MTDANLTLTDAQMLGNMALGLRDIDGGANDHGSGASQFYIENGTTGGVAISVKNAVRHSNFFRERRAKLPLLQRQ